MTRLPGSVRTLIVALGLATTTSWACGIGSDSPDRDSSVGASGTERGASALPPTSWTRCEPLDALSTPNATGPPWPKACTSTLDIDLVVSDCPSGSIALIVDDDNITRNAERWEDLQTQVWGVQSSVCDGPGLRQPLASDLPTYCDTIQRLGAETEPVDLVTCEPLPRRRNAQSAGQLDRTRTPAVVALSRLCRLPRRAPRYRKRVPVGCQGPCSPQHDSPVTGCGRADPDCPQDVAAGRNDRATAYMCAVSPPFSTSAW